MTTPIHDFYWQLDASGQFAVAAVDPNLGYWLHTALLAGLFGAGALLFATAWHGAGAVAYPRWYAALGATTVLAIVGNNLLFPGGCRSRRWPPSV